MEEVWVIYNRDTKLFFREFSDKEKAAEWTDDPYLALPFKEKSEAEVWCCLEEKVMALENALRKCGL